MVESAWEASDRPQRRNDFEEVQVDGDLVVWDPLFDRVHRIGPVGALLWPFLDGSATIAELGDDVADVFGLAEEEAYAAIIGLATQLQEASLLVDDVGDRPHPAPPPQHRHLNNPPVP